MQNKCIFLDRDGVINIERGDYTYKTDDFELEYKVAESIKQFKAAGYLVVVITNQAGISKGIYGHADVHACHAKMLQLCPEIDAIYYSPYHDSITNSLTRKPGSLLFEKALVKLKVDPKKSWMVGDRDRDLIPAKKLGMQTIVVGDAEASHADFRKENLFDSIDIIKKGTIS